MVKNCKRISYVFMMVLIVFSVVFGKLANSDLFGIKASAVNHKAGDVIEYGSYPQSRVKDSKTVSALNKISKSWKSYGYYTGTGKLDGEMKPSDYMKYADLQYNGAKYRAVYFNKYRPYSSGNTASASTTFTKQYTNGYRINTVYYFKYEPLKWKVLDPGTGFIVCENVIDSQAFQNEVYENNFSYYQDMFKTVYANNYEESSIRKWLNEDFYMTAFDKQHRSNIKTSTIFTDCIDNSYDEYNCNPTEDKIFILSHDEAIEYVSSLDEFNRPALQSKGNDYARCQGLDISDTTGNSYWFFRTPFVSSGRMCLVSQELSYDSNLVVYYSYFGVRPACRLSVLKSDKKVSITKCTFSTLKPAGYTGKAITPKIIVKNGKTTLKAGTHYTVSYKNNTKIGKATVTIKGVEKNGYTGSKTLTFNILPGVTKSLKATQSTSSIKLTWSKVAGATGYRVYRHDGKKWVKLADTKNTTYTVSKLKAGTNYKYAVKAYTAVGKAVYWSASYAQLSTATKPATPAIKVTAGKKQAAVSWKKVTGATGYVVYYSTSKNGTYNKLATVKGTSYTAKKLTTGKTYYFKVAAYKTVGKTNIYSSYSSVKSVKVK